MALGSKFGPLSVRLKTKDNNQPKKQAAIIIFSFTGTGPQMEERCEVCFYVYLKLSQNYHTQI